MNNTVGSEKVQGMGSSVLMIILPLVLAQFVASYAGSNMNVAINDIAKDLGTTVAGVQTAITLFTLTMAALMIPGSKLSDILGRKRCFILGLFVYGSGALIGSMANSLGVMIFGYSVLEGIGSALMIPPIYILTTVKFSELSLRAKAFGLISAAAGIGAAAGPLIGGFITSTISWRASFLLQVLIVGSIILLSRKIVDPGIEEAEKSKFDLFGAIYSAAGLLFIVVGILQIGTYGLFRAGKDFMLGSRVIIEQGGVSPVWLFAAIGGLFLYLFFRHLRSREIEGKEPLLPTKLFFNRVSNLGLVTQNIQWLLMQGSFFVISVYLQTVRGFSAIETGLILTPATVGILLSSMIAGRLSKRRSQTRLIQAGFGTTLFGMILLLLLNDPAGSVFSMAPGLLLMGIGIGVMLTSSVNVVQSSFSEEDQGEISGLSRSLSNLGSSLGTAIVGSVLVATTGLGNGSYFWAIITMIIFGLIGLGASILLPQNAGKLENKRGVALA